jgi:hypothetical protein
MKKIPRWRDFVRSREAFALITDDVLKDSSDPEGKLDSALTAAYRLLEAYGYFAPRKR